MRAPPAGPPARLVVDTNVFVAAGFRPSSRAAGVLRAIRDGDSRLVWDDATRGETKAVLERIPPISWVEFEELFRPEGRLEHRSDPEAFGGVPDPADRKFAALAAAADALLVTSDAALLAAARRGGFRAAPPGTLIWS